MKPYIKAEVREQQLEDVVRRHAGLIEEGLVYVDHQKPTGSGRLDVFLVDSGKSLVVAELKVTQDDGMLLQGLDYYDYAVTHLESLARLYKQRGIDPTQPVRLILVAPSFSQTLVNRCKWLDLPVSLFTFTCLKFEGDDDVVPVFTEREVASPRQSPVITTLDEHISYIIDTDVRSTVVALLDEVRTWKLNQIISVEPIQDAISMKVNGRLFAYLGARRRHFVISTYDTDEEWKEFPVKTAEELSKVKNLMKAAMEARSR